MKAMILAAGLGTRLGSLTSDMPKALVPFQGKPMLEVIIQRLKFAGFDEIIINVHHFADQIIEYIKRCPVEGVHLQISFEEELLDTGGGIKKAKPLLFGEEPILFHNVDILTDLDLNRFYHDHLRSMAKISLAVKDRPTSRHLLFTQEGVLAGWNYPERHLQIFTRNSRKGYVEAGFSGVYIFNPEIFDLFPDEDVFSLTPWLVDLSKRLEIHGVDHSAGKWFDLGSKSNLLKAESKVLLSSDGSPELKRKAK